jgi:hypothetical protein
VPDSHCATAALPDSLADRITKVECTNRLINFLCLIIGFASDVAMVRVSPSPKYLQLVSIRYLTICRKGRIKKASPWQPAPTNAWSTTDHVCLSMPLLPLSQPFPVAQYIQLQLRIPLLVRHGNRLVGGLGIDRPFRVNKNNLGCGPTLFLPLVRAAAERGPGNRFVCTKRRGIGRENKDSHRAETQKFDKPAVKGFFQSEKAPSLPLVLAILEALSTIIGAQWQDKLVGDVSGRAGQRKSRNWGRQWRELGALAVRITEDCSSPHRKARTSEHKRKFCPNRLV